MDDAAADRPAPAAPAGHGRRLALAAALLGLLAALAYLNAGAIAALFAPRTAPGPRGRRTPPGGDRPGSHVRGVEGPLFPPLPHDWPPLRGEPYPDLVLDDPDGRPVRLSSLRGKVLLVQPVGLPCSGCVALAGGHERGPFRDVPPQEGIESIDALLRRAGVRPDDPDLVLVQVLFYGTHDRAPTAEEARDWSRHFGLDARPGAVVLVGDERYVRPDTYAMIPGFQLVDRGFVLRADSTGHQPLDDLYERLLPLAADLLVPPLAVADLFPPDIAPVGSAKIDSGVGSDRPGDVAPVHTAAALAGLLACGAYPALEAELGRIRALGRRPGSYALHLAGAVSGLVGDARTRDHVDAWCRAAPDSYLAFTVRGGVLIDMAWEARGSGWANTVTEEGWRLFGERLSGAQAALGRAVRLDPSCPLAAASLVTVAMGLGLPREQAVAAFEQALRADRRFLPAFTRLLTYLMPKWCGSEEDLLGFARRAADEDPGEPALSLLVALAHQELAARAEDARAYLARPEVRAEVEGAYARVLGAYPASVEACLARAELAALLQRGRERAEWTHRAAGLGSAEAAYRYGRYLESGWNGVARDRAQAYVWYRRAAELGDADACAAVGRLTAEGQVVRPSLAAAAAWFRLGAEQGGAIAALALGLACSRGEGVPRDLALAARWLRTAAARGEEEEAARALRRVLRERPDLRQEGDP